MTDTAPATDPASTYHDPVGLLLREGEPKDRGPDKWADHVARFGLDQDHVPALIRMARDPVLNDEQDDEKLYWAPVHAWRALGHLRAEAAIAPLLALLKTLDDDVFCSDLPDVLGMIGAAAIAPVVAFIAETAHDEEDRPVLIAIEALKEIGLRHPLCRDECVTLLTGMVERHASLNPTVNGFTIWALIDLKAVASIEAIRAAFDADTVDISIAGDKEDAEIALGLREKRTTPKPDYFPGLDALRRRLDGDGLPWEAPPPPRQVTRIGRNDPCPCGSGKKYKKCCLEA